MAACPISVDDAPARIVDVSYGGLRFEMQRKLEAALPASLSIRLPTAQLSVKAKLVWENLIGERNMDVRRRPLPGNAQSGTGSSTRSDVGCPASPHLFQRPHT